MPIIDMQRRVVHVGNIRAGDKGPKGEPRKGKYWRLTSKDRQRLEAAAPLWGGTVREWEDRPGEWELYTKADQLPIMLLPGQLPTSWYELWSKGGCQRRCDGQHEIISDSPCLCGDEKECKPTTRLSVMLPDIPGLGSWLISSTGWNAANELAGSAELLERASAKGVLMPARLRLEQCVEIKGGQTRRYVKPVIDIDVAFRDLLGGAPSVIGEAAIPNMPANYTPLPPGAENGPRLAQALEEVEARQVTRTTRSAAPLPDVDVTFQAAPVPDDDVPFGEGPPPEPIPGQEALPVDTEGYVSVDDSQDPELPENRKKATPKDALNIVYNILQREGHVTPDQMYAACAELRNIDADTMTELIEGRKQNGELSWAKLRDSLTGDEIANLLDRLTRLEGHIREAQA